LPAVPEGDELAVLRPCPLSDRSGERDGHDRALASSPALQRVFCPTCGTRVMAERAEAKRIGVALALFDDPAGLSPECHFFVASKAPWVRINDDLPQYPEWPPK
jgi:hypothetical protein